jgi:hypothetical protein
MAWRVSAGTESGWQFAAPMARRVASEPSPQITGSKKQSEERAALFAVRVHVIVRLFYANNLAF